MRAREREIERGSEGPNSNGPGTDVLLYTSTFRESDV